MVRRVGWLCGLLALSAGGAAPLHAASAPEVSFDGSSPSPADPRAGLPFGVLQAIKDRPVPAAAAPPAANAIPKGAGDARPSALTAPPDDLVAAGRIWANEVQAAKLAAAHPLPKQSFRFAVIGDVEPGRFPWERVFAPAGAFRKHIRRIQGMDMDFMVQLGDIVSKGVESNYRKLVKFLAEEVRLPLMVVIGNHDRSQPNGDADKTLFKTVFGRTDFFLDYNGWRFVVLDNADRRVTAGQLAWLEGALSSPLPKLVFTHVPPGYLRDLLESPDPDKEYNMSGYFDEGSAEFRRLVSGKGVQRVYFGHIHALATAELDGVRYVLTAGGGSPFYPLPPGYPKRKKAHFIEVEIGPAGLKETVHELDGKSYPLFPR